LLVPALLIVALGIAVFVLTDEEGDATPFVYTVF
jgi:hypothetical protein